MTADAKTFGPERPPAAPESSGGELGEPFAPAIDHAIHNVQFELCDFPVAAAYFDEQGIRREANRAWFELLGLTADGDEYWLTFVHPEDANRLSTTSLVSGSVDTTVRWSGPAGGTRWLRVRGASLHGDRPTGGIWTLDDVTDQVMSLGHCARLEMVSARLAEDGDSRAGGGTATAVLLIGLDGIAEIHNEFGDAAADLVARTTWSRLRAAMRNGDYISQIAADEFLVACSNLHSADDALPIAERLIVELQRGLVLAGDPINLGVRIGIAGTEATDVDLDALMNRAASARTTVDSTGIALAPSASAAAASTPTVAEDLVTPAIF